MLTRLQSAEQLERVEAGHLAMGNYAPLDRDRIMDRLTDRAQGRAAPKSVKAAIGDLAEMGIAMHIVPPEQDAGDV